MFIHRESCALKTIPCFYKSKESAQKKLSNTALTPVEQLMPRSKLVLLFFERFTISADNSDVFPQSYYVEIGSDERAMHRNMRPLKRQEHIAIL